MTRLRRLVDDDDDYVVPPPPPGPAVTFGALRGLYDLERGLFRMQSADPASLHKAIMATAFEVSIKSPTFPAGGGTSLFAGLGSDSAESQAAALAGLSRIQARTNHPSSSRKAAEELARLYDLFAHSAQPSALLTGRKKMMESALLPAFMGNGPRSRTINIIVQAFTGYWLGAPVTGGGLVTSFLGAPDLARELNAIWNSGSNSSAQIARRLARCFIVATRKVQYTIPPGVTGMMVVFPPLAI